MARYLIDTHAWIEYFLGTTAGKRVKELLDDNKNAAFTAHSTIAEVFLWSLREEKMFSIALEIILSKSTIIEVSLNAWIEGAGHKHALQHGRRGFGLIDALLLALGHHHNAVVVTGDPHFRGLPHVMHLNP